MVWRIQELMGEGRQRPMREEDWIRQEEEVPRMVDEMLLLDPELNGDSEEEREEERRGLIEHWRGEIAQAKARYVPARPLAVRVAEAIGGVGFLILLPWVMELARYDLVSFRRSYDMAEAFFFALCVGLYVVPWLRRFRGWPVTVFWFWWVLPAVVLLPTALHLLQSRHPYLDPMNPERVRLAAEKVLNYPDFIVAADHADWVVDYAREMAGRGEKAQAVELCRTALRMNPAVRGGGKLLSELLCEPGDEAEMAELGAPYLEAGMDVPVAKRCGIEDAVDGGPKCTVVLMPMGEVAPRLLDEVAFVLERETGLRTKVYQKTLPLPEATRRRGLLVGAQREARPLVEAMVEETRGRRVGGPLQMVVVTSADLYMGDANYVFAVNYDWGSVVSIARMGENADDEVLRQRAVKLCYGSLIKSFGVPAAGDQRCVTSYSGSVAEFDAKGNRPIPLTRRLLEEAIERMNREWVERAGRGR
jgi:predicted Zn-dependent protease